MDVIDDQVIRQLFDDYLRMYSTRDDRLTTYFSENFSGFTGGGDFLVKDREQWIAITRQDFAQVKEPIRIELKDVAIQSLTDTVAVATGFFVIHLPIKDHILSNETARLVLIFRKESEGWKISHSSISIPDNLVREGEIYPLQELTARNRFLEELIDQRTTQLSGAQRLANLGSWTVDLRTGLVKMSDETCRMKGLEPSSQNTTRFRDLECLYSPESWKRLAAAVAETKRTGVPYELELETVHPDGSKGWVLTRGEPERDVMGKVVALHGISMDITERRRAEGALEESEAKLRSYLDNAPFAIIVAGPDGRIVDCNPETYRVLCYGTGELHGMSLMQLHPAEAQVAVREHLASLQQCGHYEGELRFIRKNGGEIWGELSTVLMEKGFSIGFMRDVTEERASREHVIRLEEQFRQAQKMEAVGRLAGGIAHDFNNLLMVIQSYTELMQDRLPAQDTLRKNTTAIMKAADRAANLTRQMLAFSRKQVLSPVVLDLNAVIDETAKMLRRLIGEDIEFQVSAEESLWAIEADPDQMVQILMNLCVNARDAMPQGGVLTIATGNVAMVQGDGVRDVPPGDYVSLTVSDTGEGISKEIQDQIFDPFFTTKEVGKGTGLGLATVYGIVKQSGGYVWVESELQKGSCFTIYLPRVEEAVDHALAAKDEMLVRGTETILVAEDEEALRAGMCEYLGSLGYTVLAVGSGKEALSVAVEHEGHIDLLLTDLVMPAMSGKELSQMLSSLRPDLKTIYMSGYAGDKLSRHGVQETGAMFLQKPFSLATLARKVRDTLAKSSRV